jgi:hypothetical protein
MDVRNGSHTFHLQIASALGSIDSIFEICAPKPNDKVFNLDIVGAM